MALEEDTLFLQRKQQVIAVSQKQLKRAEKRVVERKQILADCQQWAKTAHLGDLLQANLFRITKGMKTVLVSDWEARDQEIEIPLDPRIVPHKQVAAFFKRSRKLRSGESHAVRMLQLAEDDVASKKQLLNNLEKITSTTELDTYADQHGLNKNQATPHAIKKKSPSKPYHVFHTQAGMEVWVGRNAKCNDQLTFQHANGSDWWFHVANYPGSHVVLRCDSRHEPDQQSLQEAAELALRFSKIKDKNGGDVTVTQVKWLKRVKSAPGRVLVSKHKTVHIAHQ